MARPAVPGPLVPGTAGPGQPASSGPAGPLEAMDRWVHGASLLEETPPGHRPGNLPQCGRRLGRAGGTNGSRLKVAREGIVLKDDPRAWLKG